MEENYWWQKSDDKNTQMRMVDNLPTQLAMAEELDDENTNDVNKYLQREARRQALHRDYFNRSDVNPNFPRLSLAQNPRENRHLAYPQLINMSLGLAAADMAAAEGMPIDVEQFINDAEFVANRWKRIKKAQDEEDKAEAEKKMKMIHEPMPTPESYESDDSSESLTFV
jgi:hypothetical protein